MLSKVGLPIGTCSCLQRSGWRQFKSNASAPICASVRENGERVGRWGERQHPFSAWEQTNNINWEGREREGEAIIVIVFSFSLDTFALSSRFGWSAVFCDFSAAQLAAAVSYRPKMLWPLSVTTLFRTVGSSRSAHKYDCQNGSTSDLICWIHASVIFSFWVFDRSLSYTK